LRGRSRQSGPGLLDGIAALAKCRIKAQKLGGDVGPKTPVGGHAVLPEASNRRKPEPETPTCVIAPVHLQQADWQKTKTAVLNEFNALQAKNPPAVAQTAGVGTATAATDPHPSPAGAPGHWVGRRQATAMGLGPGISERISAGF